MFFAEGGVEAIRPTIDLDAVDPEEVDREEVGLHVIVMGKTGLKGWRSTKLRGYQIHILR